MHDLVIVGAGPVGGTLALAVAGQGLDVVALDARAAGAVPKGDRSLALSHGARLIFERIGVWQSLGSAAGAITPITAIDVSQAGGFGTTRLTAEEQNVPALGYVVSYTALQREIDAAMQRACVAVRYGVTVTSVEGNPYAAAVRIAEGPALAARLAVVADGSGTAVAGIERERRDYDQVALVGSVWLDREPSGCAYERFTPDGPVALLPERDHFGLVWTMTPARAKQKVALAEPTFLAALARTFGGRAGRFRRVEALRTFPLTLERARPTVGARAVVIGNAAQQLHPVAGQGFNLGLRDAWEMGQRILDVPIASLGTPSMLGRYAARRALDRATGIAFTHGLVGIFGNDSAIVRWPRGLALAALDAMPPLKRAFARAMLYGVR